MKIITFQYKDGSTFSNEWCPIMDGPWPHSPQCHEVVYKLDTSNPLYEEYD